MDKNSIFPTSVVTGDIFLVLLPDTLVVGARF